MNIKRKRERILERVVVRCGGGVKGGSGGYKEGFGMKSYEEREIVERESERERKQGILVKVNLLAENTFGALFGFHLLFH